jgi:hypothetical protein
MRFFRSEEHARRSQSTESSNVITLAQAAKLARAWYVTKLSPGWHRHTADEAEALFSELGFDREFWRLR